MKIISKLLIMVIMLLLVLIVSKSNSSFKEKVNYYLYQDNLSFMTIKNFYNKYLGGTYFLDNKNNSTYMVFNSKLSYQELEDYKDGVKLLVGDNYLVPSLEEGIVIFVGEKDDYGNTIIIQGIDGIDIWYSNIQNTSVGLYDYVEKGTYLAEAKDNYIYIIYSKGNKLLDYNEYFKS
jgi:stage IV sporulation protein FA